MQPHLESPPGGVARVSGRRGRLVPVLLALSGLLASAVLVAQVPNPEGRLRFSGIYPHLAMFNQGGECGIGAVVPWAGRLWVVTYSPHKPYGSDDKLYAVADDLSLTVRPESTGGTPANRMIHRESRQLMIGPYAIDAEGDVRVIPYEKMPGRPTATTRHLTDPANKVYVASMEEGLYEVDVHSLEVREIYPDSHSIRGANDSPILPGYHGKGAYVAQRRLVYANNGERREGKWTFEHIPSGSLGEWDGSDWRVVERNQFCEVTGPGGIHGARSDSEPIWATGWDRRSLILKLRDDGEWHTYRLPKASHTYDAYHGWYTEWPRIREIDRGRYLMTMHGMFWDFPGGFRRGASAGIRPLSSYLKIIGDFCFWNGRIVFGCDDAARIGNPLCGQSQSGLWFVDPKELADFGPRIGRGGPWLREAVKAGAPSDPYLFAGFERRCVHLTHNARQSVTFTFEVDPAGRNEWRTLRSVAVPAGGYRFHLFKPGEKGEWIRVRTDVDCAEATVFFQYASRPTQAAKVDASLRALASAERGGSMSVGLIRPRGQDLGTLHFAAAVVDGAGRVEEQGYYEIGADMRLASVDDPTAHEWLKEHARVDAADFEVDAASVILRASGGRRYRLPRGEPVFDRLPEGVVPRGVREVVTERSLLNCRGTFYELPREDAGGVAKLRPVCTHDRFVSDFCSWRGMMVLAGTRIGGAKDGHFIPSNDGRAGLWFGTIDDLWKLGKPRGRGGPWLDTLVRPGEVSDPYLMTGYDRKRLELSHDADATVSFKVEVDVNGERLWREYTRLEVVPGQRLRHRFPTGYNAYWLRVSVDQGCRATAQLEYR